LLFFLQGGLEFVTRSTTIDAPFYSARPKGLPANIRGVQVTAVDILPTEVPLDASVHFSDALMPYLRALVRQEQRRRQGSGFTSISGNGWNGVSVEDVTSLRALDRATIANDGELMPQHKWLYDPLAALNTRPPSSSPETTIKPKKKVLLFGSGLVAKPFCETIWSRSKDVELIVASDNAAEARALIRGHEGECTLVSVDISDGAKVERLAAGADVVTRCANTVSDCAFSVVTDARYSLIMDSLLPAMLHPQVARACLQHRKHLVTASYISPAMRDLHQRYGALGLIPTLICGLIPVSHFDGAELSLSMS
jgi:alpha-aminoadipic semialdehyde synthase